MVIYNFIYYRSEIHYVNDLDVFGIKSHVFVSNKWKTIIFLSLKLMPFENLDMYKLYIYIYHIAKFTYIHIICYISHTVNV